MHPIGTLHYEGPLDTQPQGGQHHRLSLGMRTCWKYVMRKARPKSLDWLITGGVWCHKTII